MHIHAIAHNNIHAFVITESAAASGARRWGRWRRLRLIRFDLTTADQVAKELDRSGHRCQKTFDVLDAFEEDKRNTGPKSGFGKALDALDRALQEDAGATVKRIAGDHLTALAYASRQAKLDQELPSAAITAPRERF